MRPRLEDWQTEDTPKQKHGMQPTGLSLLRLKKPRLHRSHLTPSTFSWKIRYKMFKNCNSIIGICRSCMKISNLYITECWNLKNFQKTAVLCWWSPHTYIGYVCIKKNLLTSLPYKHSCHCIVVSSMFLHCYRDRAYSTGIHSNQRHTPDRWVPHSPLYTHSLRVSAEQGKVRYIS